MADEAGIARGGIKESDNQQNLTKQMTVITKSK
jgi:hypothetical protein